MRIEGVAYLPDPDEYPETWEVPDHPVPLRVEFNARREPIGTATLTMHEDGTITAVAQIREGEGEFMSSFPKFAVGIATRSDGAGGSVLHGARVYGLSVCHENQNTDIPPYTVVEDEA